VNPAFGTVLQQPFVQVALPIIVALMLAAWLQNKRFDDLNRRIDEIIQRLGRIETKLETHSERITRLEERTSLVR
jgi:GTPase